MIYDPPAELYGAQVTLTDHDTVAASASTYTGEVDRIDFGGQWWSLQITTHEPRWEQAAAISAWASLLRKPGNFARIAPPARARRLGTTEAVTATVSITANNLSTSLAVTGLGAGKTLGAGSFISIADRLYRVEETVTGPSATLSIFPRTRGTITAGTTVHLVSVVETWVLVNRPEMTWSEADHPRKLAPMTLQFVSA